MKMNLIKIVVTMCMFAMLFNMSAFAVGGYTDANEQIVKDIVSHGEEVFFCGNTLYANEYYECPYRGKSVGGYDHPSDCMIDKNHYYFGIECDHCILVTIFNEYDVERKAIEEEKEKNGTLEGEPIYSFRVVHMEDMLHKTKGNGTIIVPLTNGCPY